MEPPLGSAVGIADVKSYKFLGLQVFGPGFEAGIWGQDLRQGFEAGIWGEDWGRRLGAKIGGEDWGQRLGAKILGKSVLIDPLSQLIPI
jgi:hypothetical protein